MSDSATPWTVARQAPLLDFPDKNTGAGCHFLLQGIFPTQKSNLGLFHWQADSLPLSHQGSMYTHTHICVYIYVCVHMIHNHYININIHTYNINGLAKKFIQVYSILWNNSNFLANPISTHIWIYMHWFCFSRELWPMQGAFWEGQNGGLLEKSVNLSKSSHKTEEQNKKGWRRTKREREKDRTCMKKNRPETNKGGGRSSPSQHTPHPPQQPDPAGWSVWGKFAELGKRELPLGITRRGRLTLQVGHFTTCRASSGSCWEHGPQEEGGGAGSGGSKQSPARLSESSSTPSGWTKRHPEGSAENTIPEQIREGGTCRRLQRRHRLSVEQ